MPTPVNKNEEPAVATFADHEVITPPNKLRRAITAVARNDEDPVAKAEQALADLSSEFASWMQQECDRLEAARVNVVRLGFNKATREALFHAAHDIKGEAATFGYPAVAASAESLCRLIEHTPELDRIPVELVEQHVNAVRAIIREYGRTDARDLAVSLTKRLREVTDEFLLHENRDRPEHIEAILGPTLMSEAAE
jgi:HPt (histidine-containing phosphotransfer) domain-containing protein